MTRAKTKLKSVVCLMKLGGSFQDKAGKDDGLSASGVKRELLLQDSVTLTHGGPELFRKRSSVNP